MKESSYRAIKNNCMSSNFFKINGFYNFHDGKNGELKEDKEIDKNSRQSKQLSENLCKKNISLSLNQFMENQIKKHLSSNFNHKDVKKFLKEKEKAMEEIVIDDESMEEKKENENESDNEGKEDKNNLKKKDSNKNNINNENNNNNILIFHGTFGEDEFSEIAKAQHHHRHSHHHHHHHHHHENENKSNLALEC